MKTVDVDTSYDGSLTIDNHLDVLIFSELSNLRKCLKCLINLAHLEGFEPPTTWFEVSGTFPPFSAQPCQ